jgi:RNA polymerase sigma-70 factor (ECF subfamily)
LFAFLGKITRHLAIDECRKNTSQKRYALYCELTQEMEQCIPSKNNVEEAFAADELALSINAFLATCSEDQRNIFVRRYWYFDTVAEISKKYGYSQSKVKTALFRMREGLKQHLEKEGYAV